MPRKCSVEFKEKSVHQIIEMVRLESCSLQRAYTQVGELLGVSHHTLRAWYRDSASVRDDSNTSGGETYAYLRSQEHRGGEWRHFRMMLYATASSEHDVDFELDGHNFSFRSVSLNSSPRAFQESVLRSINLS